MKLYKYPDKKIWPAILQRPAQDTALLEKTVRNILQQVKKAGDKALFTYAKQLDGVTLDHLRVSTEEMNAAAATLSPALKKAILTAKKNIEKFHLSQKEYPQMVETMPGIRCWRKPLPVEKAGFYIPGGSAPLFSTVLMLGVPAAVAGCTQVILCTPPGKDGLIHPAILFAAQCCGITQVFKVGGAQAIAAMSYGTATIPKVHKLFGPGNAYVTLAKQLVQQEGIAIDMPAGPSEVLVIADDTTDPAFAAADLLSQAEHGPDSQVMLISTSLRSIEKIKTELKKQLITLPRKAIAKKALENSRAILVNTMQEAMLLSNRYAPEHLILSCKKADALAEKVTAAGSVFIGPYSPESAGDYASGTNHTLPTNGYAAMYSGVSVDSFVKKISFQRLTQKGLLRISGTVMTMAEAEGLRAHKHAVAIRIKNKKGISIQQN